MTGVQTCALPIFIDAIPALLAGCAVLIKPSEVTPRFVGPLRAALAEVPALAAILEIVEGDGSTGTALIEVVDQVCFTGSVPTGRRVAEAAARRFIPAQLELGGTVSAGDMLKPDANGKGVTAASTNYYGAIAKHGGAAGEKILVVVERGYKA